MDEDNNDVPRVTRARTRRLSTLDTDSRPSTPQLVDATVERASPRPMRRTRLNSATIDVRTPTRSTRLSVARGETPEPITPVSLSAVKRATRTPAKSARKQLTLKEEVVAEVPMDVVTEVPEMDVADSTRNTPTGTASDERRVTRSMSKTPPAANQSTNNTPQLQSDLNNSEERKQKQEKTEAVLDEVDTQHALQQEEFPQSGRDERSAKNNLNNSESNQKPATAPYSKLQIKVKNIRIETSLAEYKTPKKIEDETPNVNISINKAEESKTVVTENSEVLIKTEGTKADNVEPIRTDEDVSMDQLVMPSSNDGNTDAADVSHDTPTEEDQSSSKKKVLFDNRSAVDTGGKPKYPKTPARIKTPPIDVFNLAAESKNKDISVLSDTPIKGIILKKRNSSTPLAKPESPRDRNDESNKSNHNVPPPQIDTIKPQSTLESVVNDVVIEKENVSRRLLSEDESEEDAEENEDDCEDEDEDEDDQGVCDFVDNEVEVVENYESGDSMDSSERQEIEENEIPHDGESVGSQDTVDNCSDDSSDENLSFIVSDNEMDDQDGIENLCFSSASDHESVDSYDQNTKKRRRIIVHDSDSDEEDALDDKAVDTDKKKEQSARKSMENSKNTSKQIANQSTDKSSENDHKTDLDKTASVDTTEDVSPHDDLPEDDLGSSSNEDNSEAHDLDKSSHIKVISVCEVLNSSDEIKEVNGEGVEDEEVKPKSDITMISMKSKSTLEKNDSTVMENKTHSEDEFKESTAEHTEKAVQLANNDEAVPMDQDLLSEDQDPISEPVDKKVKHSSKSTDFHNKQSHEDEAALLAGLSSCDLSHLQQMFNPLQKSRRQTLYIQGPQIAHSEPKPKLKRRSEQLNCDVQPSQSFIETLAEEKRQQSKRKRLSKSFCGAPDDLNVSAIQEVQPKKPKTYTEISRPNNSETEVALNDESDKEKVVSSSVTAKLEEQPIENAKHNKKSDHSKHADYYLQYCEEMLQAANIAKLEQKRQQIAAGKKPKSGQNSVTTPVAVATNVEPVPATKAKKTVKRLQAARQAVKHAVNLLVPDTISKEPQTLARKLSPQPDVYNKATKLKKTTAKKRSKLTKASPTKSSDEENHHAIKRIKTSAGYVLMFKDVKKDIELIKTRSGIVKVEPCTPTQKYFKELPPTPQSRSGLHEVPETPKGMKKKLESGRRINTIRNPATESALRFKKEMFSRNFK